MAPAARHLEVERKFDVDDSTVSPSFEGIAAVARVEKAPTQSLDAEYFDTPARDLAANRITLRRRTGGPDAGWHLKLPAGPDARTEVRVPLAAATGDEVPAELREVVLAIVRDRPLVPVARIATTREVALLHDPDGAVLAEFCDDRVAAWTVDESAVEQQWREWELELAGAAVADTELLERLGNRLLDAGAAPAAHGSKLARVLGDTPQQARPADPIRRAIAEQVDALVVWDRAVRADADDAVHQMRVSIRRLRSLLQDRLVDHDTWILDELRELARVLGVARDAEVLAQRYRSELARLPAELVRGRVVERLVDGAVGRYQSGLRRAVTAMRSPRYFRLLDGLDALVSEPRSPADAPTSVPAAIKSAHKRVRRSAKTAARAADQDRDEALHRIRKAAKRLRYTAAAAGASKVSERAKTIQTLLGDHQDSVVSRMHLGVQADAAHAAGEDTFTYGLLYQQEADLAHARRARLNAALADLDKAVRRGR